MAAEVSSLPVNGNHAPYQGYGSLDATQNNFSYGSNTLSSHHPTTQAPLPSSTPATSTSTQQSDIPKDEVGWYFVEQYYTTLSRSPEKLYLFYNKRSQFVSGQETDKVQVCVGQRAINDRIKDLDFQDCKVRVTNVDSQASDANIVIQVIGEISNKSQPHKKFSQTFVLATQTNGYFVLNDIFRYLIEEEDEAEQAAPQVDEPEQSVPAATDAFKDAAPTSSAEAEPKGLTSSTDPTAIEHDANAVDEEIEEKLIEHEPKNEEESAAPVNGVSAEDDHVKPAEDVPSSVAESASIEEALPEPQKEEAKSEKPKEPEPSPVATPAPSEASSRPAAAPKPSVPKTWASLAASANRSAPVAVPAPSSQSTAPQAKVTPPSTKTSTAASSAPFVPSAPTAPAAQREESPAAGSQDEWTAVGGGHNRQQSRQTNTQPPEVPNRGYIKNVYEGVDYEELKTHLTQFGELAYFDIARQKNCAFVDFKTAEGYNGAIAANPHTVNGERLFVEERRVGRPGSTPYVPRGQFQGGRGRGGPGQGGPRGNFQGRGNYTPRGGRGGAQTPRGRGGAPTA